MNNNTQVKKIKIIFSIFILFSNAIVYLLASNNVDAQSISHNQVILRQNHITLKIAAELKVPFSTQAPVTLVSIKSGIVIKNVFLIHQLEAKKLNIAADLTSLNEFYIEVHKSEFNKINKEEFFHIYPNNVDYKSRQQSRRAQYEINY